jgi:hypothetical protein
VFDLIGGLPFSQKAFPDVGPTGERRVQKLHRNAAAVSMHACIDGGHPADPEHTFDRVLPRADRLTHTPVDQREKRGVDLGHWAVAFVIGVRSLDRRPPQRAAAPHPEKQLHIRAVFPWGQHRPRSVACRFWTTSDDASWKWASRAAGRRAVRGRATLLLTVSLERGCPRKPRPLEHVAEVKAPPSPKVRRRRSVAFGHCLQLDAGSFAFSVDPTPLAAQKPAGL